MGLYYIKKIIKINLIHKKYKIQQMATKNTQSKKVESKKVETAIAPKVLTKKYFQKEYFKDFINKSKKIKSSNITILDNFCFVDNKVICSDVENYLILNINHDFNFCVNSKLFIQILETTQTFSIEQGDDFITLEANGISYKLKTESVKDYPIIPIVKEVSNKYLLQSFLFKDLMQFTGNDVLDRKAMTGLYIGSNDFCVTNAQQLKVVHHNLNIEGCSLIINKTALSLIIGSDVYFRFDKHYSEFVMGSLTLISRNIDAIYPDYPSIYESSLFGPHRAKILVTSELLQAIKQSSITANKITNFVKIEILKDKIIVQSNDLDFGLSSYSEVKQDNIMNIVDSFVVGFDYKQFLELFNIGDIILMETPERIMVHSDTLITKGMCTLIVKAD